MISKTGTPIVSDRVRVPEIARPESSNWNSAMKQRTSRLRVSSIAGKIIDQPVGGGGGYSCYCLSVLSHIEILLYARYRGAKLNITRPMGQAKSITAEVSPTVGPLGPPTSILCRNSIIRLWRVRSTNLISKSCYFNEILLRMLDSLGEGTFHFRSRNGVIENH